MAKLKPWFQVVTPREDLRENRPLDASEFAVHLDHIKEGKASADYTDPARFFERTYLTKNLTELAVQVVRRLSGMAVETSAIFNMATQFGGGKTHALTLLYHLANGGSEADRWMGVSGILSKAGVKTTPKATPAIFVGTEFDSITGRGGKKGEPLRKTPWGDIAWQLSGKEGFATVAKHDESGTAPGGDTINQFLPDGPTLILMDELLNYVSRHRKMGLSAQLYTFIHNLSEVARSRKNVVLAVSIPASELEMNAEDQRDYESLKKMLDRLGKAIIMSAETEAAEIIRRRLFEWYGVPEEARKTAQAYAEWMVDNKSLLGAFDVETARDQIVNSYPFHPALLSVFERKWQALPRFQKTRGMLRLLALWVSRAFNEDHLQARKDALISLGSAPLEDSMFRAALLEQLGNTDLEVTVTTDIAGKPNAHAVRLDREAEAEVKKFRLHQKVATVIFFESNGGQAKAEATVPEVRVGVGEPEMDIANVETSLEALTNTCYYLTTDRNRYRFGLAPNLIKTLTDRRASIQPKAISQRVREEIEAVFKKGPGFIQRFYFPAKSGQIADQAKLALVVLPPEMPLEDKLTLRFIEETIRECGPSGRTFKSALLFAVPSDATDLVDRARSVLAWEDISDDDETIKRLDDAQRRQLAAATKKAADELKESVWRAYKNVVLLGRDNKPSTVDFGLIHSSAAPTLVDLYVNRLRQDDEITEGVGASKVVKYWPPSLEAWSTKAVRDAFFASPQLPRLMDGNAIKRTISNGISEAIFAYAAKDAGGRFTQIRFDEAMSESEVELTDDVYLLTAEAAKKYIEPSKLARIDVKPNSAVLKPGEKRHFTVAGFDQHNHPFAADGVAWSASGGSIDSTGSFSAETLGAYTITAKVGGAEGRAEILVQQPTGPGGGTGGGKGGGGGTGRTQQVLEWAGSIPAQKWTSFYMKVLTKFATAQGLDIQVRFRVPPNGKITPAMIAEIKNELRDLGLSEDVKLLE